MAVDGTPMNAKRKTIKACHEFIVCVRKRKTFRAALGRGQIQTFIFLFQTNLLESDHLACGNLSCLVNDSIGAFSNLAQLLIAFHGGDWSAGEELAWKSSR